jgi:hypothetical protein
MGYMHKIYYFLFILFLFPGRFFGQGEFNNWCFGWRAGMTFDSIVPIPILNSAIEQSGGVGV